MIENCPMTVFTKPWKRADIRELAGLVVELGFDGVELAVRTGYQVEPENARERLPEAVRIFREHGLRIESVATDLTAEAVEACQLAGVPILRTMLSLDPAKGYHESVRDFQETCVSLEPHLSGSGVKIGVQNHCGNFVGTAIGLMEAIAPLSGSVVAVLDLAHTSLCGEPEPYALEIALPRLAMVNLKNAVYAREGSNDHGEAVWKHTWVGAREGLTSWSLVVELLRKHRFTGPICLTAEYRNAAGEVVAEAETLPYIQQDLGYFKSLLANGSSH